MYVYNESDRNYILIMGQGGTYDSKMSCLRS